MNTPQKFVYIHQAKLAWKLVKHGVGVALMTEDREGHEAFKPVHPHVRSEEYIEVPVTH